MIYLVDSQPNIKRLTNRLSPSPREWDSWSWALSRPDGILQEIKSDPNRSQSLAEPSPKTGQARRRGARSDLQGWPYLASEADEARPRGQPSWVLGWPVYWLCCCHTSTIFLTPSTWCTSMTQNHPYLIENLTIESRNIAYKYSFLSTVKDKSFSAQSTIFLYFTHTDTYLGIGEGPPRKTSGPFFFLWFWGIPDSDEGILTPNQVVPSRATFSGFTSSTDCRDLNKKPWLALKAIPKTPTRQQTCIGFLLAATKTHHQSLGSRASIISQATK